MARYDISLAGAEKVWEQEYPSKVCSPVVAGGYIYWAWKSVNCLDFETGKQQWRGGDVGDPGSVIVTGDDRLIVWADRGDLFLVETAVRSPRSYTQLARSAVLDRADAWPHVVLANGRLYCKDRDGRLRCLQIAAQAAGD